MITKLVIDNFKCFDCGELDLSALNLLTGPNSSGKSTAIQAILLLFQEAAAGKTNMSLAYNSDYIHLGEFSDIKNSHTSRREIRIKGIEEDGQIHEICLSMGGEFMTNAMKTPGPFHTDFVYLDAERIGVEEIYKKNMKDDKAIGARGEYSFAYLSEHKNEPIAETAFVKDADKGLGFSNQVDDWLDYILGYHIQAEAIPGMDIY